MGGRQFRSTYSALELLTEQVHTIWNSGKYVASLLSLDISGAFDTVVPLRLLDVLRKKGIPGWIIRWVRSFLSERQTTISISGHQSTLHRVPGGAPQGSPLSLILFLFYNAELMSLCSGPRTTTIGFVDDTNILAYGKSTAATCKALEEAHSRCLLWAKKFGIKFAPSKYELIHFTRRRHTFDLSATVRLGDVVQDPKTEVRILGV
jgi:Reverse transcriptase (RNA-dependent DNA polymerase)